jgi:hypothetical protein
MKKRTLLIALISMIFMGYSSAQNCSAAQKLKCQSYTAKSHCLQSSAARMAALDQNIVSVLDETTSGVKYVRKAECPFTGSVSYEDVKYDAAAGTFISCDPAHCNPKNCEPKNCDPSACKGSSNAKVKSAHAVTLQRLSKAKT